jgi:hypothetical protein
MKLMLLGFLFLSSTSWACRRIDGLVSINDTKIKINQKIDHDKIYTFSSGIYHLNLKYSEKNENTRPNGEKIEFEINEIKSQHFAQISKGIFLIKTGKEFIYSEGTIHFRIKLSQL